MLKSLYASVFNLMWEWDKFAAVLIFFVWVAVEDTRRAIIARGNSDTLNSCRRKNLYRYGNIEHGTLIFLIWVTLMRNWTELQFSILLLLIWYSIIYYSIDYFRYSHIQLGNAFLEYVAKTDCWIKYLVSISSKNNKMSR